MAVNQEKLFEQISIAYKVTNLKPCKDNFQKNNTKVTHVFPLWALAIHKGKSSVNKILKDEIAFGEIWDWCNETYGVDWTDGFIKGFCDNTMKFHPNPDYLKGVTAGEGIRVKLLS